MALVKPLHSGDPDVMRNSHAAASTRLQRRRSRVRFPVETQHSQMLYGKDVDGSGQASTEQTLKIYTK